MELLVTYQTRLQAVLAEMPFPQIMLLGEALREVWTERRQVFLCGNGGSAVNALHMANDFFYGIAKETDKIGMKAHALAANQSITSCIANDVSYDAIFSEQLKVFAHPGDVLIALSGSGNSPNIVNALLTARDIGVRSFAILGYSGGKCLSLADTPIHFPVNDMQIAEDAQVVVGHMIMQWLQANPPQAQIT